MVAGAATGAVAGAATGAVESSAATGGGACGVATGAESDVTSRTAERGADAAAPCPPATAAAADESEHSAADPEAMRALGEALGARLDGPRRRELGRMCKRLLDVGRLRYLQEHARMAGQLQTYCDEAISPENVLLLAWPQA